MKKKKKLTTADERLRVVYEGMTVIADIDACRLLYAQLRDEELPVRVKREQKLHRERRATLRARLRAKGIPVPRRRN